jgi:hypothetical protein
MTGMGERIKKRSEKRSEMTRKEKERRRKAN